jgi:hypothetical protein
MQYYQQGDVLIKPVKRIPRVARKFGHCFLTRGDAIGRHHSAYGENLTTWITEWWIINGTIFLDAPKGAEVRHKEHLPISVPPGVYRIEIVREYDHFGGGVRNVRGLIGDKNILELGNFQRE